MSKAVLKSLALLGALAVASPAFSSTVNVAFQNSASIWNGNGHVSADLTISYPVGNTTAAGGAGAFALTDASTTNILGNFIAFCVDVADYIRNPPGMHETSADITTVGFDGSRIYAVQALFNTAYAGVLAGITDNDLVAGFQLALWELLYEPYSSTVTAWDVASGGFNVASAPSGAIAGAVAKANAMLAALDDPETGDFALTFLKSTDEVNGRTGQNLITATASPAPVPVPAAGLLLLAGLAGLGFAARRRRQA